MLYDQYFKIKKVVQEPDGHLFEIDWDSSAGRCPECNELITVPVYPLRFYRISDIKTAIGTTNGANYLLKTPDTTTRIHITYTGTGESITLTIQLFESPTTLTDGDRVTNIPNKRDEYPLISPELEVFYNPSISANGTVISTNKAVSQSQPGLVYAPDITPDNEFILAQNTKYLLKLTPSAESATINTVFNWMEVK